MDDSMAIDFIEREDEALEVMSSMNITPLIDVLLVLLVMFIVTIPIQLHSANIEMPAGSPHEFQIEPSIVRIEIAADGRIAWNGEPVSTKDDLVHRFDVASHSIDPPEIHIHPNRFTPYDVVALVITMSQQMGMKKIGVVGLDEYDSE
jgi:biopolymer transport protein ExbD